MPKSMGAWAFVAVFLFADASDAGLLPVNVGVKTEGDNFRYTYGIQLQSGAVLKSGDYFTIFDFAGLVGGMNTQPAGFTFSTSNAGPVPPNLKPADDETISNLTWTFTGGETTGPINLGDFSAVSEYQLKNDDYFTARSHREVDGRMNGNITSTQVPVPVAPQCMVPEPSTLILLAAGVPLILGLRRFRRV